MPRPFARRGGVLSEERTGQLDETSASRKVGVELSTDDVEVGAQRTGDPGWKHGHSIFVTLAIAHEDAAGINVEIFDSKSRTFEQAQTRAVKEARHEPGHS